MNKLRIYIAGPMRGLKNLNKDQFFKAEKLLNNKGIYITQNPARWDDELGLTPEDLCCKTELLSAMRRDLNAIFECDCLFMLRGWEKSQGARLEHALAVMLELTIIYQQ